MASQIDMPTKNGDPLKLTQVDDDILLPLLFTNIVDKLKPIKDLEHRENDVLLCSYPKSGTHWTSSLIRRILATGVEESKKNEFNEQFLGLLEMAPPEKITTGISPRIMASHLRPRRLPTAYLEGKAKIVLVFRNPKDVAVSFYYHLKNSQMISNKQVWDEYFNSFQSGIVPFRSCLDYLKAWETELQTNKSLDIAYFYYEDLKANGLECVRRLAKHLGYGHIEDKQLQAILDDCSLTKLKAEDATINKSQAKKASEGKDGQSVIYRKGEVADWKNHFTVAQNEMFDKKIKDSLDRSMFTFRYE